jgi:hypothetical protein
VDLLDDAGGTNGVNLPGFYNLKPDITVVIVVGQSAQGRTDARVDVGVVLQKTLHRSVVEVCSVVDACDFARGAAEDLGLPGVKVRVEVDHGDWSVGLVHAAKDGEGDGVVAAHGDDTRESLALLCKSRLFSVGGGLAHEDAVVAFFDLVDGPVWVVPSDDQAGVLGGRVQCVLTMLQARRRSQLRSPTNRMGSRRAARCSLHCPTYQIRSQRKNTDLHLDDLLEIETTTSLSDTLRAKSCTWPVAGAGIVRGSEERDIVFDLVGC